MEKKNVLLLLIVVSVITAVLILVQQLIAYGSFFEVADFLHHEDFATVLVFFALGIAVAVLIYEYCRSCGGKNSGKLRNLDLHDCRCRKG